MKNENHVEDFRRLRPQYEALARKTDELVNELFRRAGITLHTTEFRAKSVDSFSEKIKRPGKTYSQPLAEMPDLAGVRVIAYYQEDVEAITTLILNEFAIAESVDKREELNTDQFGYASIHLVVSVGESRRNLPEWNAFSELMIEIQIRTVLQHAWASISHALQYKRENDIPATFRRKLVRLSGLFELGDEQFSELRKERVALESELKAKFQNSDFSPELDAVSIEEYLNHSELTKYIFESASEIGLGTFDRNNNEFGEMPLDLPNVTSTLGLETVDQLNDVLSKCKRRVKPLFRSLKRSELFDTTIGDDDFWCAMLIVLSHPKVFTAQQMTNSNLWGDDTYDMISKAMKKRPAKKRPAKKRPAKKRPAKKKPPKE